MRPASNPPVLPPAASQFSLHLHDEYVDAHAFAGFALPADLMKAVPKRQLYFRAGRCCAREALRRLDPGRPVGIVARDASGCPVWPTGTVGSITHTEGFVSAAAALARDAASVGIDAERIMSAARAREVATHVAWPSELAIAVDAGLDRLEAMTLAFSAKEAFFKCAYPLLRKTIGFHAVRLMEVDSGSGGFTLRIAEALPGLFALGAVVQGRFSLDAPWMHTGMLLPPSEASGEAVSATEAEALSACATGR